MSKIDRECLTKSERKLLHLIMRNTLHKNTPLKREKRSFKMSNETMAQDLGCNERTIQRAIKRFSEMSLIKRNTPPKKFMRGAHYISISDSFYERTKDFFEAEKNVTHKEKNVGPIKINIKKTISLSLNNLSKKTNTNNNRESVQFFISEKILEINLHDLDEKIGLTHSDLQRIHNKAKWSICDIQESVTNFATALAEGTFVATQTSPKIAFIAILGGSNKRLPTLFNKNSKTDNKGKIEPKLQIPESADYTYWLSLDEDEKNDYLTKTNNNLDLAIKLARKEYIQAASEFSLSKILIGFENFNFNDETPRREKNAPIKFKLE